MIGIPGVKVSLLEEFGIRLVTYDLPGFGESDPHPERNLNSSALDMQYLANALGVNSKFWVLGYSSGAIHAWAAMKFIPDRVAGMFILPFLFNSSLLKRQGYFFSFGMHCVKFKVEWTVHHNQQLMSLKI